MPDFLTHFLFGQKVFISQEAVPLLARRADAPVFLWGQQGPDPFFYRGALSGSPLAPLGEILHRQAPGQFFYSAARFTLARQGRARETAQAYLAGLLCHYAVDRALHPYIAAKERELAPLWPDLCPTGVHYQIETDLDTDLCALWRKTSIRACRPWEELGMDPAQREEVGRMWSVLLGETCRLVLDPQEAVKALDDTLRIVKITYMGGAPTHFLARGLEAVSGKRGTLSGHIKVRRPRWDSLNLGGVPWTGPGGETRAETVPQLLERAEKDARKLLADYGAMLQAGEIQYRIFEENYSGMPEG